MSVSNVVLLLLLLMQPLIQALIPSHLLCCWSLLSDLPTLAFKYFSSRFAFYYQIRQLKLLLSSLRHRWWSSSLLDWDTKASLPVSVPLCALPQKWAVARLASLLLTSCDDTRRSCLGTSSPWPSRLRLCPTSCLKPFPIFPVPTLSLWHPITLVVQNCLDEHAPYVSAEPVHM